MPGYDEAITYIVAGALLGESVTIENIEPAHLQIPLGVVELGGARIARRPASLEVSRGSELRPVSVVTGTHPAMNSDLQPAFAVYGCCANGATRITDTRFTQRFGYREELQKLGAEITVEGNTALIEGPCRLQATTVSAPDLRAGAALVLAGMVAEGETAIGNLSQIDRGFEGLEEKLAALGADVRREKAA
jgi:UDP-N-acetylglucosamine 1-carboxyvinyltransferase